MKGLSMGAALLILAALADVRQLPVVETSVDVAEVNHFYDGDGKLVFDQVIFYDWCAATDRFQVRAWRLMRSCTQRPLPDRTRGGYVSVWMDGEQLRSVRVWSVRESWTQDDPELLEREVLNRESRKELGK